MSDKHYTHQGNETQLELALRRLKPWFEANATFLIYGLAAVLAVAAAVVWVRREPKANSSVSSLWMGAQGPEDFQNIADQHVGTQLGSLARLKQADTLLDSATRKMFTDRAAANQELELAEAALSRLSDVTVFDDIVHARVLMGLARLAEIRCNGTEESVATATQAWQDFLEQNKTSIGRELAEHRIAELRTPAAASFYAWFHALDPTPADDLNAPDFSGSPPFGSGSAVPPAPPNLDLPILPEIPAAGDSNSSEDAPFTPADTSTDPSADETSDKIEELTIEKKPAETTDTDSDFDSEDGSQPAAEEPAIQDPDIENPGSDDSSSDDPANSEPDPGE